MINRRISIYYCFKWLFIILAIAFLVGSAVAFFLYTLDVVTQFRTQNFSTIYFLPIAGIIIGLMYHYFGKNISSGNNLILEEYYKPKNTISYLMVPFIYISTMLTHGCGGSAGREGTAVQMGVGIAYQFSLLFNFNDTERRLLILLGISSGFSAIFGTPFAAVIFAFELTYLKSIKLKLELVAACVLCSLLSNFICDWYGIKHTQYIVSSSFDYLSYDYIYLLFFGVICGVVSVLFIQFGNIFSYFLKKWLFFMPLRAFVGGLILAAIVLFSKNTTYLGLGIDTIERAFVEPVNSHDFILKILFTTFTLSAGFKGGEVTPLFFIGSTMGNAFFPILPLNLDILVAIGFVAVFAASANTPLACALMGAELFGTEHFFYLLIACYAAFFSSRKFGIYTSQQGVSNKTIFNLSE